VASSAASSAGAAAGPPRASSSARAPERGSFSCQTERRFSSRLRRVIPAAASDRRGVSKYVDVNTRSISSPGSAGNSNSAGADSFTSRSTVVRMGRGW
jgi:hypothetical protein